MARFKTVRGPPHSSIRQSDSQPLDLEHNRPSASAGRFECSLPGCSSSLGTKDVFKKQVPIVRPLHRKQCIVHVLYSFTIIRCDHVFSPFKIRIRDICQRVNRKMVISTPELHPEPVKAPWFHIGIDFVGPLPTSLKRN